MFPLCHSSVMFLDSFSTWENHHYPSKTESPRGYEPGASLYHYPTTLTFFNPYYIYTFFHFFYFPIFHTPVTLAYSTRSRTRQFSAIMDNLQSLFESMHEQLTSANCKVKLNGKNYPKWKGTWRCTFMGQTVGLTFPLLYPLLLMHFGSVRMITPYKLYITVVSRVNKISILIADYNHARDISMKPMTIFKRFHRSAKGAEEI